MSSEDQFIRLETVGRKSGRPHTVLLRFITFGNQLVVFADNSSKQDWVLNLKSDPKVRIHTRGKVLEGTAHLSRVRSLRDPVLSVFSRKYGDAVVRSTYWGKTDYVGIDLGAQVATEDFHELVYADLEAAFDGVAPHYDRHIFGNPVNVWLRNRSLALMSRTFREGDTILEVGCGTGTETLALAARGINVLATDISSKMLAVLMRHAEERGLSERIVPIHSRPNALLEKVEEAGYSKVDGAYSTYGAVNTDPMLTRFFDSLHRLVVPGGRLILGVWNRYCAFEILGYTLKANPTMASARFRNPVPVGRSRFCVASNALTVGEISKLTAGTFALQQVSGVGILLPPSNLTKYLPPRRVFDFLKRADVSLQDWFPWNRLGDHFLTVYRRV